MECKFDGWAMTAWLGLLQESGTELSTCHMAAEVRSCKYKMTWLQTVQPFLTSKANV